MADDLNLSSIAQRGNAGNDPDFAATPAAPDPRLEALRAAERELAHAESAALGAPHTYEGDRRRARVEAARRAVMQIRAAWRRPSAEVAA